MLLNNASTYRLTSRTSEPLIGSLRRKVSLRRTAPNGKLVEFVNWRWRTRPNSRLPPPMSSTNPLVSGVLLIAPR